MTAFFPLALGAGLLAAAYQGYRKGKIPAAPKA
jgi:hypothetical protein